MGGLKHTRKPGHLYVVLGPPLGPSPDEVFVGVETHTGKGVRLPGMMTEGPYRVLEFPDPEAFAAMREALEAGVFEATTKALEALRTYDDETDPDPSKLIGEALYEIEEFGQKADAALALADGEAGGE